MSNRKKLSVKEKISAAKRPERVVVVNLRGDLIAEIQDLEAQLEDVRDQSAGRLGDHPEARKLAEKIQAVEAEAEDYKLSLRLRAVQGSEWRKAIAACPPTEDQKEEGYIMDVTGVVRYVLPGSVVDPELDAEDLAALEEGLTEGQWKRITEAIFTLNGGDDSVPFSQIASHVLRNSAGERK